MMGKLLPKRSATWAAMTGIGFAVGLGTIALPTFSLLTPLPTWAQRCTTNCGSRQIQFTPGERIRVLVVNRTSSLVQIEQIYGTNPIALLPSQEIEVDPNFGTRPNASVVLWDETELPIRVVLFRPDTNMLRIEVFPGGRPPGDRSVYIEDDGKVRIF